MSEKFFPVFKSFFKHCFYLLFIGGISITSCVKDNLNDISGDVMLKQSLSLPLGTREMSISAPSVNDTSSVNGTYGKFYYNGLPYSSNVATFQPIYEEVSLNLTANHTKSEWIKKITFQIAVENDYPSIAILAIYLVDGDGKVLDQVFGQSGMVFTEAKMDSKGNVLLPSPSQVKEVVYEGSRLELLKQAKYLVYQATVQSLFFETPVRLTDANKLTVDIGVQATLEYKAQ